MHVVLWHYLLELGACHIHRTPPSVPDTCLFCSTANYMLYCIILCGPASDAPQQNAKLFPSHISGSILMCFVLFKYKICCFLKTVFKHEFLDNTKKNFCTKSKAIARPYWMGTNFFCVEVFSVHSALELFGWCILQIYLLTYLLKNSKYIISETNLQYYYQKKNK